MNFVCCWKSIRAKIIIIIMADWEFWWNALVYWEGSRPLEGGKSVGAGYAKEKMVRVFRRKKLSCRSVGPVYQLLPVLAVHKQHAVVAPSHPLSNWEKTRFAYLSLLLLIKHIRWWPTSLVDIEWTRFHQIITKVKKIGKQTSRKVGRTFQLSLCP